MKEFRDQGAIVTGAASGIGRGLARSLAHAGARLALADIQVEPLEALCAELRAAGGEAIAVPLDVSDREAVREAAARIDRELGKVHLVFNNAGVELGGTTIEAVTDDEWDWILGVNFHGVLNGVRHFLPLVRRHGEGGHVMNTASVAGFWVNPTFRLGPYAVTKQAVVALTEALALDLAGSGIGVSLLCPAAVNTRIHASAANRPARFGGPYVRGETASLAAALAHGLSGEAVADRALAAIRAGEFYVFTHREPRDWFRARFERILAAFDTLK